MKIHFFIFSSKINICLFLKNKLFSHLPNPFLKSHFSVFHFWNPISKFYFWNQISKSHFWHPISKFYFWNPISKFYFLDFCTRKSKNQFFNFWIPGVFKIFSYFFTSNHIIILLWKSIFSVSHFLLLIFHNYSFRYYVILFISHNIGVMTS